jgi:pyridoxal phosphate enzyme (YggS family)
VEDADNRWREIGIRIEQACRKSGRRSVDVTLVGASKTVSATRLVAFVRAGLADVGENYVQEALRKQDEIQTLQGKESSTQALRWHLLGALQSNKARDVVGRFSLIHSVDRWSLAQALSKASQARGLVQDVLLQVNIGEETSKAGCAPHELGDLARRCLQLPNLRLRGLMCLPPYNEDAEKSRIYFRRMRELQMKTNSDLSGEGGIGSELSMGMTNDFPVAVEEGATIVRVGTGLFGARG